jgi:hypothetical protein
VSTRLFVILARDAPVAAVLRRGPSKQVLLVRWDLTNDTFEAGQWLNGRVYERRCDLSPSGDRFIYFAATHKPPLGTWTAISRLPYFTALAVWPKGDAWGGGGLFTSENEILINHQESQLSILDDVRLPKGMTVKQTPNAGGGEDAPIYRRRLERDGWELEREGDWEHRSLDAPMVWVCNPPETWTKPHPDPAVRIRLRMRTLGVKERQGPWYVLDFDLLDDSGEICRDLGGLDWADWDRNGDLLFAEDGALHRLTPGPGWADTVPRVLIDLSGLSFEQRPPLPQATSWTGPRPRGVDLR